MPEGTSEAGRLAERAGWLVVAPSGCVIDDDLVRALRQPVTDVGAINVEFVDGLQSGSR